MFLLNKKEKDIIIGSLLGDGSMYMMGRNINPIFSVSHGENQKDYVFWKYQQLKRWVNTPPWREKRIYHKDITRKLVSWRFQTISNSVFSETYQMFYFQNKKIIPDKIDDLLWKSPLALAVWIMDDGNKNHRAVFLNTQSFSLVDQKRLIRSLEKIFGLKAMINKHSKSKGKQLYRIRINTESTKKLVKIVGKFILPEFKYKIPILSP